MDNSLFSIINYQLSIINYALYTKLARRARRNA